MPAKPLEIHKLHGTRSQAGPRTEFAGGRPKPPRHLSDAAKVEFRRVSKLLGARKTETPADAGTIALYAELTVRWIGLKAEVEDRYLVETSILDSHGEAHVQRKVNPLLKELAATERTLIALSRELGLTPASRDKTKPLDVLDEVVKPGTAAYFAKTGDFS